MVRYTECSEITDLKNTLPIVLSIVAVSACAFAQAPSDPIQKALMAAPARAKKEDITVIKWKPDFSYDTLQKGASGGLVCWDLSGWPNHPAFMLECTSMGNLARVAQNLKAEAMGNRKASEAAFTLPKRRTEPARSPSSDRHGST